MAILGGRAGLTHLSEQDIPSRYNVFSRFPLNSGMPTQASGKQPNTSQAHTSRTCFLPPQMEPQYIQLWENACFLFRSLDLKSALREFGSLEPLTTCSHVMTILLLNIGIILCHLGDYQRARIVLTRAVYYWNTFPMALFLLGISAFELGLYLPAQEAFSNAALAFEKANVVTLAHSPVGLHYVLTASHIQDNELSSAFANTLEHKVGRLHPVLHRLPAGLIFESPLAPLIQAACALESMRLQNEAVFGRSEPMTNPIISTHSESPKSTPKTMPPLSIGSNRDYSKRSPDNDGDHTYNASPTELHAFPREATNTLLLHRARSIIGRLRVMGSKPEHSQYVVRPVLPQGPMIEPQAIHQKVTTPRVMVPREARIASRSLHELSDTIRHTGPDFLRLAQNKSPTVLPTCEPPSKPKTRHMPRDARPEVEDLTDLASFIKYSGPSDVPPIEIIKHRVKLPKDTAKDNIDNTADLEVNPFTSATYEIPHVQQTPHQPRTHIKRRPLSPAMHINSHQRRTIPEIEHDRPEKETLTSAVYINPQPDTNPNHSPTSSSSLSKNRSSSIYSRAVDVSHPWDPNFSPQQQFPVTSNTSFPHYIDINGVSLAAAVPRPDSVMDVAYFQDHADGFPSMIVEIERLKCSRRQ